MKTHFGLQSGPLAAFCNKFNYLKSEKRTQGSKPLILTHCNVGNIFRFCVLVSTFWGAFSGENAL